MKKIPLTYYVLYTAKSKIPGCKRGESKYYVKESEYIREAIGQIPNISLIEGDISKHEEWVQWEVEIQENSNHLIFSLEHFKSRMILKTTVDVDENNFGELFKQARKIRAEVEKILEKYLDFNGCFSKNLKSDGKDQVKITLYRYFLIEIGKQYSLTSHTNLQREFRTTFFYDATDPYPHKLFPRQRYILIRLSRLSIITSKMSEETRNRLIQAIYHSCLHKMREKSLDKPDEEIFDNMRIFVEEIFYKKQAEISQIDEKRFISLLTIIASLASLAAILGIVYILPFHSDASREICERTKSIIGIVLLTATAITLAAFSFKRLIGSLFKR